MARLEYFQENLDAVSLHVTGVELAKGNEFDEAHLAFSAARQIITRSASIDPESSRLQVARITRDDGFTYVRQALRTETTTKPDFLESGLRELASAQVFTQILKDKQSGHYSSEAWWGLRAEHGATLGLIARLATAAHVLEIPNKTKPLHLYIDAYQELSPASNRYYDSSNSMNAARQMMIEGSRYSAKTVWLGRALRSAERAAPDDPNKVAALRDIKRREKFIKSPRVARSSVFRAP